MLSGLNCLGDVFLCASAVEDVNFEVLRALGCTSRSMMWTSENVESFINGVVYLIRLWVGETRDKYIANRYFYSFFCLIS